MTSFLEGETATYSRLARGARAEAHTATSLLSILSRKSFLLLFFLLQFPSDRGLTLCRRLLQLETLAVAGPLISCFLAGYICQEISNMHRQRATRDTFVERTRPLMAGAESTKRAAESVVTVVALFCEQRVELLWGWGLEGIGLPRRQIYSFCTVDDRHFYR